MSTDRELLELAARAAGYRVKRESGDKLIVWIDDSPFEWSPLADDGDVARLEADLEIGIRWDYDIVTATIQNSFDVCSEAYSEHNDDKREARRYASVRAAAEIGKSK